jgi:hypothetical protein
MKGTNIKHKENDSSAALQLSLSPGNQSAVVVVHNACSDYQIKEQIFLQGRFLKKKHQDLMILTLFQR